MTSVKLCFRHKAPASEGYLYYRITHRRHISLIASGYRINAADWDSRRAMIALAPTAGSDRAALDSLNSAVCCDLRRIDSIVNSLAAASLDYSAADVAHAFRRYRRDCSLFRYMSARITDMRGKSVTRTVNNYAVALNSFRRFRQGKDLMLDALTPRLLEDYEAYLRSRGIVSNTTSCYMRILRAVYNRAVSDGLITDANPFRRVYTGVDRTLKRALTPSMLRRLARLDLSSSRAEAFARDMFLLSFYLRGMSLIDMAFIRSTDLADGAITYRRHKTGHLMRIAWTPQMQSILDRYPKNDLGYLLPIITRSDADPRRVYLTAGNNINYHLRKIARRLGLDLPLTLYCARHSWATAARHLGIPLPVISEGMGHDSETTTLIYLSTIETTAVDKANARIIKALKL